jgi:hypothetical protein
VDLRRAVSWATDYQGMVKILSGNGKQMRAQSRTVWGFDATAMQYSLMTKAKDALEKVKDKPASLTFLYSDNDPNWEPIALSTRPASVSSGSTSNWKNWLTPPCVTASEKAITTLLSATGALTSPTRTCS